MVELLYWCVRDKSRPFSKVPDSMKPSVEAMLKENGYDTNGDRLPTEL